MVSGRHFSKTAVVAVRLYRHANSVDSVGEPFRSNAAACNHVHYTKKKKKKQKKKRTNKKKKKQKKRRI